MASRLFYTLIAGFTTGIGVFSYFLGTVPIPFWVLLSVVVMGVGGWWCAHRYKSYSGAPIHNAFILASIFLIAFAVGIFRADWHQANINDTVLKAQVGETVTLTGYVVREPDVRERTTLMTLETADTRVLLTTDRHSPVWYGDYLSVTGKLQAPEPFVTDLGRTFDYPGYLEARGVTHTMSFVTPTVIQQSDGFVTSMYAVKSYFLERLGMVIPAPAVGLGAGLLLGVQSGLGSELEEAFRVTGITHIVVLSGFNIMIVVTFVLYVLALLLPFRWRLWVGILAVVLFALLVGYSPSVMRASAMAIIFLLGTLLARPYLILRALLLAGVIMIMINPTLLRYDIGFQLSFMATLGLILVAPMLESWFAKVPSWRLSLKSFVVATMATQIAVAPLILYYLGEWSVVAVPVNLLVLPLVPLAMLLTFLTGLVALVSVSLAVPLAWLATLTLSYIIFVAETFARLPYAAFGVAPFPGVMVLLAYLCLGVIWYWLWYRPQHNPRVIASFHTEVTDVSGWTIVAEESLTPCYKKDASRDASSPSPLAIFR